MPAGRRAGMSPGRARSRGNERKNTLTGSKYSILTTNNKNVVVTRHEIFKFFSLLLLHACAAAGGRTTRRHAFCIYYKRGLDQSDIIINEIIFKSSFVFIVKKFIVVES